MSTPMTDDLEGLIVNRLALEWVFAKLTPMERDILFLWAVEELSLEKIGRIVGLKYRGKPMTGSSIRYRKEYIKARLGELKDSL